VRRGGEDAGNSGDPGIPDQVVDCVGLFCPNPIIQTAARLKEMAPGEILEVLADDATFPKDIPDWCAKTGYEFLGVDEEGGEFKARIRVPG